MFNLDNDTIFQLHRDSTDRGELEELFATKAVKHNPEILKNTCTFPLVVLALNREVPNFDSMEMPDILMVSLAIHKLIKEKLITDLESLGESTLKYIACLAFDEGWIILPRVLAPVQRYLNDLTSDHADMLFKSVTLETLEKVEPWDDEDPVSLNCAKIQAVNLYLEKYEC